MMSSAEQMGPCCEQVTHIREQAARLLTAIGESSVRVEVKLLRLSQDESSRRPSTGETPSGKPSSSPPQS